jgi:DNA-directed RNA polymerase specialized sigma24 family protein
MQIQVNTDSNIVGTTKLIGEVEAVVGHALARYGDRITRDEVFLSDENSSQKFGDSDKRCVLEARLGGLQPVTVSHKGSSLDQAVDGAADKLEKTLKRTLGRKDSLFKRRTRARTEFNTVDPLLQQNAAFGNQEEFLTLLRPLLDHLRDHARRELRILEINGLLPPDHVTAPDLLNEVMARAWLRFAGQPRQLSLDLWLMNLLDETLDETTKPESQFKRSLDQRADELHPEDVPQVDDQDWWVWLLAEDEVVSVGDAAPRGESDSALEQAEAEELKDRVHALLGELPKVRRQAFALNVLEGYDVFEIAMLQDRPETEVQADIEAARNMLREQLPAVYRPPVSVPPAAEVVAASADKPK